MYGTATWDAPGPPAHLRAVAWHVSCCPGCAGAAPQDLISRYDVKDVLPKLRAYSHEWDAEVEVSGHLAGQTIHKRGAWIYVAAAASGAQRGRSRPKRPR